ncbi:MAG: hypothetical protein WDN26_17605 [Chitinophagaceae bacterium]
MRKGSIIIYFFICHLSLYGQVITAADIFTLTSLPEKKISSYVSKKGFVQTFRNIDGEKITQEYFYRVSQKQPVDSSVRYLSRCATKESIGISYQTSSIAEYTAILNELNQEGFEKIIEKDSAALFFQKNNITIKVNDELQDELKIYRFLVDRKEMPATIKYADDLLSFNSHENLSYVFGEENVKKDVYFFSENETTHCSVLFPNTSRQVIFMWDDQVNNRQLAFILIGGSLRSESSMDFNKTISMNAWQCRNGLHPGMKLKEVIQMNESDFDFFGQESEFAMMAVPEKKGIIDFKKTGIVLSCLNCTNTPAISSAKVSAESAAGSNLSIYVLSIVLVP